MTSPKVTRLMNRLAEEVCATIRTAITAWPQTLRLIALLSAATASATLIILLDH
jgi:hypothetical protein